MSKTNEQITSIILKKIHMILLSELPEPTCAEKKLKWRWQIEEVKKKVSNELSPSGVNIEVKV